MTDPRPKAYSTPRWVKAMAVAAAIVAAVLGIAMVTGIGGDHGPGRHTSQDHNQTTSIQ
jgi:hypothetical protein